MALAGKSSLVPWMITPALQLGERLGRQEPQEIVYAVCMDVFELDGDFRKALLNNPKVSEAIDAKATDGMLDPHGYTGMAGLFVDPVVGDAKG